VSSNPSTEKQKKKKKIYMPKEQVRRTGNHTQLSPSERWESFYGCKTPKPGYKLLWFAGVPSKTLGLKFNG
jgi:hypothetical protein